MPRASATSRLVIVAAILHPTTGRLNGSTTTARYSHPSRVGTYVTSATHDALGSAGSKSRSDTFGATGCGRFESVACRNFRLAFAATPAARMTRATVFTRQS